MLEQVSGSCPSLEATTERKGERHTQDEQEIREDEIGRCPPVSLCMPERPIDERPASWIVDEDHAGDGEAAKRIQ